MAAKKKPAAKRAADKQFAEPKDYEGVDQPADDLSPSESLKADEKKAKELAEVQAVADRQDEELQEVRDIHAAQRERWRHHDRTEVAHVVRGIADPSDSSGSTDAQDGPAIKVFTGDGRCHIETDGEVVLDQNGVVDLRRFLDQAFQAVS